MLKKRRVPRVLLSLALLAPWGALRAVPGVTDTEIVIGQSLGLTGTANVGAVLTLLDKEDPPVPSISPFTGANLLRDPPINHVFNVRASYGDEVEKLVQHLTTLGVQRNSVLWMSNGFGKDRQGSRFVDLTIIGAGGKFTR